MELKRGFTFFLDFQLFTIAKGELINKLSASSLMVFVGNRVFVLFSFNSSKGLYYLCDSSRKYNISYGDHWIWLNKMSMGWWIFNKSRMDE